METDKTDRVIQAIDNGMEQAVSITIEKALEKAVERWNNGDTVWGMPESEAAECLEAYRRNFHSDES